MRKPGRAIIDVSKTCAASTGCLAPLLAILLALVACLPGSARQKTSPSNQFAAAESVMVDGKGFIDKMYSSIKGYSSYSFKYTMKVYKRRKPVVENGVFYYKKPGLIRLEEKGPYKKGAVAVLGKNGKVKAHLGGGLKMFVVELSAKNRLLKSANGHPMVESDFLSLARALRSYTKAGMTCMVTKEPVKVSGVADHRVHLLKIIKKGKTDAWKRIAVQPGSLLPVQWWDYNDKGKLRSHATWHSVISRASLPDQLFTIQGAKLADHNKIEGRKTRESETIGRKSKLTEKSSKKASSG